MPGVDILEEKMTDHAPLRSAKNGKLICRRCLSGYAAEVDELCTKCRSQKAGRFTTAWDLRAALAAREVKP